MTKNIKISFYIENIRNNFIIIFFFFTFALSVNFILSKEIILEWEVIEIYGSPLVVLVLLDYISTSFIRLVSLVAGCVLVFRNSYIKDEPYNNRFIILVILFVLSIFLLIMRPNIISLLLGWDGLGVTSYLLVVFYQRRKSYNAGILTALTNRLGDVGILISIGMILISNNWNLFSINLRVRGLNKILVVILLLSACTKSAQVPFSAWLPAAIAAPTPVSALVHSSTLVTAGVYLLIRFRAIIIFSSIFKLLMIISIITIIIAGISAIWENDFKKIIALSTLSQLGVIIITIGVSISNLAFFHLLSHAYFKAILFICAGHSIHLIKDYQDIRTMGRRITSMTFMVNIIIVANLSLCGLPFLRGFYSKDLILEMVLIIDNRILYFIIVIIATLLTVSYSFRIIILLISKPNHSECFFINHNIDFFIVLGIIGLFNFSIWGGIILNWNLISESSLIFLPFWLKRSIIIFILLGLVFSYILKLNSNNILVEFIKIINFLPLTIRIRFTKINTFQRKTIFKLRESSWTEIILYNMHWKYFNLMRNYFNYISIRFILRSIVLVIIFIILY